MRGRDLPRKRIHNRVRCLHSAHASHSCPSVDTGRFRSRACGRASVRRPPNFLAHMRGGHRSLAGGCQPILISYDREHNLFALRPRNAGGGVGVDQVAKPVFRHGGISGLACCAWRGFRFSGRCTRHSGADCNQLTLRDLPTPGTDRGRCAGVRSGLSGGYRPRGPRAMRSQSGNSH